MDFASISEYSPLAFLGPKQFGPITTRANNNAGSLMGIEVSELRRSDVPSSGLQNLLARERIIAAPGYSRWLVPPAALAIHLCIGMAYGFSVFWLPLSHALGIDHSVACAADSNFLTRAFSTGC